MVMMGDDHEDSEPNSDGTLVKLVVADCKSLICQLLNGMSEGEDTGVRVWGLRGSR